MYSYYRVRTIVVPNRTAHQPSSAAAGTSGSKFAYQGVPLHLRGSKMLPMFKAAYCQRLLFPRDDEMHALMSEGLDPRRLADPRKLIF